MIGLNATMVGPNAVGPCGHGAQDTETEIFCMHITECKISSKDGTCQYVRPYNVRNDLTLSLA